MSTTLHSAPDPVAAQSVDAMGTAIGALHQALEALRNDSIHLRLRLHTCESTVGLKIWSAICDIEEALARLEMTKLAK